MAVEKVKRKLTAMILKKCPETTTTVWREKLPHKNPKHLERVLAGLKKAGMP